MGSAHAIANMFAVILLTGEGVRVAHTFTSAAREEADRRCSETSDSRRTLSISGWMNGLSFGGKAPKETAAPAAAARTEA